MADIRSFKELRVWQNAMESAMIVFEVTKRFPVEERYSMMTLRKKTATSSRSCLMAGRGCASNTKVGMDEQRQEDAVIRNFRITAADGKSYDTKHYNLAANIIAVGYKVNSERTVQFRKWATGILNTSSKVAGGEHNRRHRRGHDL